MKEFIIIKTELKFFRNKNEEKLFSKLEGLCKTFNSFNESKKDINFFVKKICIEVSNNINYVFDYNNKYEDNKLQWYLKYYGENILEFFRKVDKTKFIQIILQEKNHE